ncbi:MAG: hypothetical protein P4L27_12020, partial [Ignavibacteriaceae bacterium]|nr:hypothetical protein [Ignavibacteriaceae bacterium]
YLLPLRNQDEVCQKEKIISIWQKMDSMERYIWNKLLTGTFRVDITSELVIKAFSSFCGLETAVISHRLSVNWEPSSDFYEMLISSDVDDSIACSPFSDTPEFKPESEPEHIPFSVNAVLLYARMGQGRGFSVFMEYTFAIWHNGMLVPFAKTSKGLSDEERIHMESFIYNNTIEKFGPVRSIKPELIFELEFDGVQESPRHKSGVIALSPRISRWCHDKNLQDVASLDYIKSLIDSINH